MNVYEPELMYALDSLSEYSDWKNVYNVSGSDVCYCPICLGKVKLWNGQNPNKVYKKQRCFHHIDGVCSQESRIHFAYKNWLLEPNSKFKIKENVYEVASAEVEKTVHTSFGDYRPDIIVNTTCGKTFFIEVAYTNKKTNEYIYKWDELGNDVIEIDVNEQMYIVSTKDIPTFKLIYSSDTGECYIKQYIHKDYDDLITDRKIYWKRKDVLNYKLKWEKLDWFWRDLKRFYHNDINIESLIETFKIITPEDQRFICNHLKGKHFNLKYELEKHYTDKSDFKKAHLKRISNVVKSLNKEFGYSTSDEYDDTYLFRKGHHVIFKNSYRWENRPHLYIYDDTTDNEVYNYFYPIMKEYYVSHTIPLREKISERKNINEKNENNQKYFYEVLEPILSEIKVKINNCKNNIWHMDYKLLYKIDETSFYINIILCDVWEWSIYRYITIEKPIDNPQEFIEQIIFTEMNSLFCKGLIGTSNCRILKLEER